MLFAVQIAAWFLAGTLLYVACFLREDEEGRLQDRLATLWLAIDDLQTLAVARHTAFLRIVAAATARLLEKVFGERLVSWRAFGASACLSLASLLFIRQFFHPPWTYHWWSHPLILMAVNVFMFWPLRALGSPLLLLLGVVAAVALPVRWPKLSFIPPIVALLFLISNVDVRRDLPISYLWHFPSVYLMSTIFTLVVLVGGMLCDFIFVIVARKAFGYAKAATLIGVLWSLFVLGLMAYVLSVGPLLWMGQRRFAMEYSISVVQSLKNSAAHLIALICTSNLLTLLVVALYVACALLLLIHRAIWPLPSRVIYALERHHLLERRTWLVGIAVMILTLANPRVAKVVVGIAQAFK